MVRPLRSLPTALFGAVLLGVGALLGPRARPEEHWSQSPKVRLVDEVGGQDHGGPPPEPE